MALLTLRNIGKIYVSEGNVTVGIRGVDLSFDRGEFVAVTGKSGSGKSTLLNVISGMDTYEEGELLIEGAATSHYLQSDWETYRQKYISFIFQDYNIIESFTVLQNVELALMHIEDPKARRERALELLCRVGLSAHIRQKGSQLSGGQKQRTVIARALAKDSPIILADEPTGNLDSATAAEIMALLREVSHDKLLIVVTHSFDEVERYATRHIRIFDGAVEFDRTLTKAERPTAEMPPVQDEKPSPRRTNLRNGALLGRSIFKAKPRLTLFLCLLMILGTAGIFLLTSLCGNISDLFAPHYMFSHIEGRVVVVHRDGTPLTDAELSALGEEYGAERTLRYDALLDEGNRYMAALGEGRDSRSVAFVCTYGEEFGEEILGRYPEAADEVLLYLPIFYQPLVGETEILQETVLLMGCPWRVVGVKYYYDNTVTPRCLFTEKGFTIATAAHYLRNANMTMDVRCNVNGQENVWNFGSHFHVSFDLAPGKIAIQNDNYRKIIREGKYPTEVTLTANYRKYNYAYYGVEAVTSFQFTHHFADGDVDRDFFAPRSLYQNEHVDVVISAETVYEIAHSVLSLSYRQGSLFFADDAAAATAAAAISGKRFVAVPSNTECTPDPFDVIVNTLAAVMLAVVWVLGILFLAFFVNLCSGRALEAFRDDITIMRSMGIPTPVLRVGVYVRMLLCLVPAYITAAVLAFLIFRSPTLNGYFVYLHAPQYLMIALGMLLLTLRTTHKQIRRLFGKSVKKSLKGGNAE